MVIRSAAMLFFAALSSCAFTEPRARRFQQRSDPSDVTTSAPNSSLPESSTESLSSPSHTFPVVIPTFIPILSTSSTSDAVDTTASTTADSTRSSAPFGGLIDLPPISDLSQPTTTITTTVLSFTSTPSPYSTSAPSSTPPDALPINIDPSALLPSFLNPISTSSTTANGPGGSSLLQPTASSTSLANGSQSPSNGTTIWLTATAGSDPYLPTICQASDATRPVTYYSIIYTSTITIYGPALVNMTLLYPHISTPLPCIQAAIPNPLARCNLLGELLLGCDATTTSTTSTTPGALLTANAQATIFLLTTAQQPTVVYSSALPSYGLSGSSALNIAQSTIPDGGIVTPDYVVSKATSGHGIAEQSPATSESSVPVTIGIHTSDVVIDGSTFTDSPNTPTQTVTVSGNVFTIDSSAVVGAGATVTRPTETPGNAFAAIPTSTVIAGVTVEISSSVAVIDGTSYVIGPTPITKVVQGETVSIGPGGVAVAADTIPVTVVPQPTQMVVQGGNLITVIGNSLVVIDGTTINYRSLSTESETVLDGDTVTIETNGVTVRNMTFGGPTAGSSVTDYEIVGGATITEIGDSTLVIDGTTLTAPASGPAETTVVGNETLTIGPGGVIVSTLSFPFPNAHTTIITPTPTGGGATGVSGPKALATTKTKGLGGTGPRPDLAIGLLILCIAIGVLI